MSSLLPLVYNDQIEFVKKYVPEYLKSVRHVSKLDGDGAVVVGERWRQ